VIEPRSEVAEQLANGLEALAVSLRQEVEDGTATRGSDATERPGFGLSDLHGPGVGDRALWPADLTAQQLAVRFNRSPGAIRGWIRAGRLPGSYRLRGREWRIPPEAVAAFEAVERRRSAPESATPARPRAKLSDWRRRRPRVS
jgi:hypothetical protein